MDLTRLNSRCWQSSILSRGLKKESIPSVFPASWGSPYTQAACYKAETLPTKVHLVKAMVFLVVMYGCENWTIKKAQHWRIDAFELWCWKRLLRVPWTGKEIQPVNPKGNQSWIFIGRTDAEAETPILWPPDAKSWLIWEDPDAGKDWRQEEKGMTEDEMVWWHHWLNGCECEWNRGVGDGQGGLACCNSWVAKSRTWLSDWTELNWTEDQG